MKNYVCLYVVEALDIEDKPKEYYGLIYANSFTDAMKTIENDLFGNDLLTVKEMELFDTTIELSKEVYALVKKELNEL